MTIRAKVCEVSSATGWEDAAARELGQGEGSTYVSQKPNAVEGPLRLLWIAVVKDIL